MDSPNMLYRFILFILACVMLLILVSLSGCLQQNDTPVIVGEVSEDADVDSEHVLPPEVIEQISLSLKSDVQVRSSMFLGEYVRDTGEALGEYEREVHHRYLVVGTHETRQGVKVTLGGALSTEVFEDDEESFHTQSYSERFRYKLEQTRDPVFAVTDAGRLKITPSGEYWASFLFGWIQQPDEVAEVFLRFSNGQEISFEAESHQFFTGVIRKVRRPSDRERDHMLLDEIRDIELVDIIAYDHDGEIIE